MTDQLTTLLNRYADDMAAGMRPPPPSVDGSLTIGRLRLRRIALPVLAACSVAAVAAAAAVLGKDPAPAVVGVAAAGAPEPLRPGDTPPPAAVLHAGLGEEDPAVAPELNREGLHVSVELPAVAVVEALTPYTVILRNSSDRDAALRPCPGYRIEHGGQGTVGRLPCDRLPESVAAGQLLRVELAAQFGMWDGPDQATRDIDVVWGIAGPAHARGRLSLEPLPLGDPVATASFVADPPPPGEPVTEEKGLTGKRPEWRLTPTIISAPKSVRAGETLHYSVRLVNTSPNEAVPMVPCRGFTQWLQRPLRPAGEQVAFLDWSFEREEITSLHADERMLNCDALPASLAPRTWVRLEMELRVPGSYVPGETSLAWKVGELDVLGSMQSRYVTVRVLPPR